MDGKNKENLTADEAIVFDSSIEWQRTFDHISDSIFIQDKNFTIIKANKATFDLLRLKEKDIIGKKCFEIFHKLNKPWKNCPFEKTRLDYKPHTEEIFDDNIGMHLLITTSPIFEKNGDFYGSVHIAKDISVFKKAEEKLRQNEAELKRLASFPELNPKPIIELDLKGNITYQNPAAKIIFPDLLKKGVNHQWLLGWESILKELTSGKKAIINQDVIVGKNYYNKTIHFLKDHQKVRIYGTDITEQKKKEVELHQLNRILSALSNSNQLLLKAEGEMDYLKGVCKIITENCGYKMVWIGYAENDENKTIKPVAFAGFEKGYLETLNLTWANKERGKGPTGTAIRNGKIAMCKNMQIDSKFNPWREEALKRGYASSIVFPLKDDKKIFGSISIYSEHPNPFSKREIALLKELASDVSYGIISSRAMKARFVAEESLQKNEAKLMAEKNVLNIIMNNAKAGLAYIGRDFNFIAVNSVYCKSNGRTEGELLGKNYFDFFPSEESRLLFEKVIETGQQIELNQKPLILKNQRWQDVIYLDWTLSPVKNSEGYVYGLVISLVNVSERVKLIESLKIHGNKLEQITSELKKVQVAVENASDIIFITDEKGKIIYINKAIKNILGHKQKELIGKKPNFWMEDMPNKFFRQMWQKIYFDKEPFIGEIQDRKKDGDLFTAEIRIAPVLDKNGKILSFVGIERDITEAKRLDTAKTEFISLAAHQLRTPITTVNLTAELLLGGLSGKINKETEEHLQEIMVGVKKMSEMVELFLNVSRIEMKTFEVLPRPLNVAKIIEENIKYIMPQIKKKDIELRKNISKNLPIVNVDHNVMDIILDNLLSNAIKYTPSNGVIKVEAEKEMDNLIIKVSDTGCGILKKYHENIFEKLFRAENMAQKVAGVGLGLYLCKALIEQAGGKIWLDSETNKGSTFFVSIPLNGMRINKRAKHN